MGASDLETLNFLAGMQEAKWAKFTEDIAADEQEASEGKLHRLPSARSVMCVLHAAQVPQLAR